MADNFYATLAQVLPLLLLAFIWDSGFLARLRRQRRLPRRIDSTGVLFWTKPRVRVYTLMVAGVVILSTAVTVFVLAGLIPDSYVLRITLSAGLVLVLITLLTRIILDVLWATRVVPEPASSFEHSCDEVRGFPSHTAGGSALRYGAAVDSKNTEPDVPTEHSKDQPN